jgi:hypothetical protein
MNNQTKFKKYNNLRMDGICLRSLFVPKEYRLDLDADMVLPK